MPRNFFRRVEVAFPVEEENMQEEILQTMKDILSDNSMASELRPGGKYATIPRRRKTEFSAQENLVSLAQEKKRLTLTKPRSGWTPGETENQSKTNQKKPKPHNRVT